MKRRKVNGAENEIGNESASVRRSAWAGSWVEESKSSGCSSVSLPHKTRSSRREAFKNRMWRGVQAACAFPIECAEE